MFFYSIVLVMLSGLGIISGSIDQDFLQNSQGIINECKSENNVNSMQLAQLATMQVPSNQKVRCFLACLAKKTGAMDATTNTFSKDGIMTMAAPYIGQVDSGAKEKLEAVMNQCIAQQGSPTDGCEAASNAMACVIREARSNGLM